jgi:hypothetical protein
MSDLSELQKREKNGTFAIKTNPDGTSTATLGLDTSGKTGNQIAPVTVKFDKSGNAIEAHIPNQAHSGATDLDLTRADPKVKAGLLNNAGRGGADYLANVAKTATGERFEANHSNSKLSLGADNPSAAERGALQQNAVGSIVSKAGRAAHIIGKVIKPVGIATGAYAAMTGAAHASTGHEVEGAANGFSEHVAPGSTSNSICQSTGAVIGLGASGALGIIGGTAGAVIGGGPTPTGVLGAIGGAVIGAKAGDYVGQGTESVCSAGVNAFNSLSAKAQSMVASIKGETGQKTALASDTAHNTAGAKQTTAQQRS